jgi:hypothetical protein
MRSLAGFAPVLEMDMAWRQRLGGRRAELPEAANAFRQGFEHIGCHRATFLFRDHGVFERLEASRCCWEQPRVNNHAHRPTTTVWPKFASDMA